MTNYNKPSKFRGPVTPDIIMKAKTERITTEARRRKNTEAAEKTGLAAIVRSIRQTYEGR